MGVIDEAIECAAVDEENQDRTPIIDKPSVFRTCDACETSASVENATHESSRNELPQRTDYLPEGHTLESPCMPSLAALLGDAICRVEELAAQSRPTAEQPLSAVQAAVTTAVDIVTPESLCRMFLQLWQHLALIDLCGGTTSTFERHLALLLQTIGIVHEVDISRLAQTLQQDEKLRAILQSIETAAGFDGFGTMPQRLQKTRVGQVISSANRRMGTGPSGHIGQLTAETTDQLSRLRCNVDKMRVDLSSDPVVCEKAAELLLGTWKCVDQELANSSTSVAAYVEMVPQVAARHIDYAWKLFFNVFGLLRPYLPTDGTLDPYIDKCASHLHTAGMKKHAAADMNKLAGELLDILSKQKISPDLKEMLLQGFDDDVRAHSTATVLNHAEVLLQRSVLGLKSNSFLVDSLDRHCETQNVAKKVKEAARLFEPAAFLADFENALRGDTASRNEFLNDLLDIILDGVLQLLPSIHVPEVNGTHHGVAYTVFDLDMSGLHFQRDNVTLRAERYDGNPRLCLEMRDATAEFRPLRCRLRPPKLPEVTVVTSAQATGISLCISLSFADGFSSGTSDGSGESRRIPRCVASPPELQIETLTVALLDNSKCAKLFNPLVGFLRDSLHRHLAASLVDRLTDVLQRLCCELGDIAGDLEALLGSLGVCDVNSALAAIPGVEDAEDYRGCHASTTLGTSSQIKAEEEEGAEGEYEEGV